MFSDGNNVFALLRHDPNDVTSRVHIGWFHSKVYPDLYKLNMLASMVKSVSSVSNIKKSELYQIFMGEF